MRVFRLGLILLGLCAWSGPALAHVVTDGEEGDPFDFHDHPPGCDPCCYGPCDIDPFCDINCNLGPPYCPRVACNIECWSCSELLCGDGEINWDGKGWCGNHEEAGSEDACPVLYDPEECDGTDLGGKTCQSLGFDAGELACREDCSGFDTSDCRFVCGNGVVGPDEECDDGDENSDTRPDACRTDCTRASCVDGVVDTGEACDDGNFDDTDGCLDTCKSATCGDGKIQADVEECDRGSINNSDTTPNQCRTNCLLPYCGDGVVDDGEECDEGAANSSGGTCRPDCTAERCDDAGAEPCDDTLRTGQSDSSGSGCQKNSIARDHHRPLFWIAILALAGVLRHRRRP